jgi:hypothetical protein
VAVFRVGGQWCMVQSSAFGFGGFWVPGWRAMFKETSDFCILPDTDTDTDTRQRHASAGILVARCGISIPDKDGIVLFHCCSGQWFFYPRFMRNVSLNSARK